MRRPAKHNTPLKPWDASAAQCKLKCQPYAPHADALPRFVPLQPLQPRLEVGAGLPQRHHGKLWHPWPSDQARGNAQRNPHHMLGRWSLLPGGASWFCARAPQTRAKRKGLTPNRKRGWYTQFHVKICSDKISRVSRTLPNIMMPLWTQALSPKK